MADPKKQIHAELMALRADGADNHEIIRAACTKLFAAGIIPNQVNVLEVIRTEGSSPSVLTVRKGIAAFWETIRSKVGALPDILADGVPEPILEVLKGVAPQLAIAAEKVGHAWYEAQVANMAEATQKAIDAAEGYKQVADDAQARLDTVSAELARERDRAAGLSRQLESAEADARIQAGLLQDAQAKAQLDGERIERLESDFRAARTEAAESKDAYRLVAKELAAVRESAAALRAQLGQANALVEQQVQAHEKSIDNLKTAHAAQVGSLGFDLAKVQGALKESESEKQALLAKNGELTGEVKAQASMITTQTAEIERLKGELRAVQDEVIEERARRVNNFADAGRVVEWIRSGDGRRRAVNAFTEGPERQIAYAVEDVLLAGRAKQKEGGRADPDSH